MFNCYYFTGLNPEWSIKEISCKVLSVLSSDIISNFLTKKGENRCAQKKGPSMGFELEDYGSG